MRIEKVITFTVVLLLVASWSVAAATPCEQLPSLALENATIVSAETVAAGAFTPPASSTRALRPGAPAFKDLPGFCRVSALMRPTRDSSIRIEVWLPTSGWNGKFLGVGNGGWAGEISYDQLGQPLARGYATGSTDTGHQGTGNNGSFALGHPEKIIDFGSRAVHEMTTKAKLIVAAYYGQSTRLSYWNGCSTGGRQGLMEAQRFPADYDGIIAGAPANNVTGLHTGQLWAARATLGEPGGHIPTSKYPVLRRAALDACDALDGVRDGVIGKPLSCHFDPQTLACRAEDGPDCLTPQQVESARTIYRGPRSSRIGQIHAGLEPGSELGWAAIAGGPGPFQIANDYFRYFVFGDPKWDYRSLDLDRDVTRARTLDKGTLDAVDTNLSQFTSRGGKLLQYHGWNDPLIGPRNSVAYHDEVVKAMAGINVSNSYRLFMLPGVNHCGGGDGPGRFDAIGALERWVEHGEAPNRIVASRYTADGRVDRTRPLCPYPQVAQYRGGGGTDDAASFVCTQP